MGLSDYLTEDGKLTQTLEFSIEWGGINPSTDVLTVDPSGEWRERRIQSVGPNAPLPDELQQGQPQIDELQQGQLTASQLAALAHQLAALELLNLPDKLLAPFVNPPFKTIRFGNKGTTLSRFAVLPSSEDPEAAAVARFIALELVIKFWTKGEEQRTP